MNIIKKGMAVLTAMTILTSGSILLPSFTKSVENLQMTAYAENSTWDGSIDTSWYDSQETEFHLSTAEELAGLASIVNGGKSMKGQTIILDNNIYLNELVDTDKWESNPPENNWIPIGNSDVAFEGVFDGNDYAVLGMYYTSDTFNLYSGLFGAVNSGTIKNLNVKYAYVNNSASILCGKSTDGTIEKCNVNATVRGTAAFGGICFLSNGTINNCISSGDIQLYAKCTDSAIDDYCVAGICAMGDAYNCKNEASLQVDNAYCAGGVIALGDGDNLTNTGTITCTNIENAVAGICGRGTVNNGVNNAEIIVNSCKYVGGVVGVGNGTYLKNEKSIQGVYIDNSLGGTIAYGSGDIEHCTNNGIIVSDAKYTGGIVGECYNPIYSCFNNNKIQSDNLYCGGIAGYSKNNISKCGNNGNVIGSLYVGGITGYSDSKSNISYCYNKSEIESKTQNSQCGGIVGIFYNYENLIKSCYNTGNIDGITYSGGIAGIIHVKVDDLACINCYSTSSEVAGEISGGLAGEISDSCSFDNCYYLNAGASKGVGNVDDDIGIAKSAVNMKKEAFAESLGNAFLYVEENYPVLCWELGYELIDLDKAELSFSEYGATETITAITSSNEKIEWSSSDELVATVDQNGVVTAVGNGNCTITAKIGESKAICKVSVEFDYYFEESGFRLDVDKGKTLVIYSRSTNQIIDNSEIEFSSTNETVASVNAKGIVSANTPGVAYIKAKVGSFELTCKVVVNTIMGDVNADSYFTTADVIMLQKWLVKSGELTFSEASDFDNNDIINVFDLCIMKRELLNQF